ncbi:MAG: tRNA (guanosine(37)-N1)-methyltransferase TrmD [Rickettsiales bacterium]|nr:tRNA (guanosine(37)-N1)-methyltransferase TrmD [Pseudomonadota bacterium]MDA0966737.1 tRNA (guanosine(37)-N1)-methyltransferase TrmD [Pseudomonadota bacterium]MDG4543410.1 tRNA (guanosine(37)-N1)-methyltransferase TrmD [Rickettsiales bacterium]MDG4546196.1 tRNA (guanosine(37)-N1)-methyltransferase TrmD [Rickettsiales bacterium]MDG4547669.1 tRNA (guanosine(37)-N1)-methyltransferase TrmD [Rickettsiales bacterium]
MTWKVKLFTIFPEMFPGSLGFSLAGKAREGGIWDYEAINIRDYATDAHKSVDDTPAGGGAGMVMRADVLGAAIEANTDKNTKIIYMSPRGNLLTQKKIYELANCNDLAIICGRFEGIDERIIEEYGVEEVSIGDYILSGGEVAATVLMDGCIRLIDGVIGNKSTLNEESFGENEDYAGLLEYPLYTRPVEWKGKKIPDILSSGHHKNIDRWRLEKAEEITESRRPDLWNKYCLVKRQQK